MSQIEMRTDFGTFSVKPRHGGTEKRDTPAESPQQQPSDRYDPIGDGSSSPKNSPTKTDAGNAEEKRGADAKQLSKEEEAAVAKLKARDAEVRAHEAAHVAAGGHYVRGGASYEYQSGPDGKRYAVGGEVSIDSSAVSGDPAATIQKMMVVRQAALAPANPSGQDRAVAAAAAAKQTEAQRQKTTTTEQPAGGDSASDNKKADDTTQSGEVPELPPQVISAYENNRRNGTETIVQQQFIG